MLTNMFIGDPPGNYDRILDFSTAVTGTCSSCPSVDFLDDPRPLPPRTDASGLRRRSRGDGRRRRSLGIGSLRGGSA